METVPYLFDLGIIAVKRRVRAGAWTEHVWLPHAILPAVPAARSGTKLGGDDDETFLYAGATQLLLQRSATAHYRDNINAACPSLWISLRVANEECEAISVTADPYEGEALTEGLGSIVEALPMPRGIRAGITAFIDAFHVERPFFKRQRDGNRPERRGKQECRA